MDFVWSFTLGKYGGRELESSSVGLQTRQSLFSFSGNTYKILVKCERKKGNIRSYVGGERQQTTTN